MIAITTSSSISVNPRSTRRLPAATARHPRPDSMPRRRRPIHTGHKVPERRDVDMRDFLSLPPLVVPVSGPRDLVQDLSMTSRCFGNRRSVVPTRRQSVVAAGRSRVGG